MWHRRGYDDQNEIAADEAEQRRARRATERSRQLELSAARALKNHMMKYGTIYVSQGDDYVGYPS